MELWSENTLKNSTSDQNVTYSNYNTIFAEMGQFLARQHLHAKKPMTHLHLEPVYVLLVGRRAPKIVILVGREAPKIWPAVVVPVLLVGVKKSGQWSPTLCFL